MQILHLLAYFWAKWSKWSKNILSSFLSKNLSNNNKHQCFKKNVGPKTLFCLFWGQKFPKIFYKKSFKNRFWSILRLLGPNPGKPDFSGRMTLQHFFVPFCRTLCDKLQDNCRTYRQKSQNCRRLQDLCGKNTFFFVAFLHLKTSYQNIFHPATNGIW